MEGKTLCRVIIMNEADIRKYAALMKELELTGLELTEGDKIVRLERNISANVIYSDDNTKKSLDNNAHNCGKSNEGGTMSYMSIKSPMVGVFYAAPAENAEPYVKVGSHVKKGQTLCIVEAMKLMNEITAEADGVISQVCVSDGQMIEYGTELFKIEC